MCNLVCEILSENLQVAKFEILFYILFLRSWFTLNWIFHCNCAYRHQCNLSKLKLKICNEVPIGVVRYLPLKVSSLTRLSLLPLWHKSSLNIRWDWCQRTIETCKIIMVKLWYNPITYDFSWLGRDRKVLTHAILLISHV